MVAHDRPLLLVNTIGIASFVCITYAYVHACFTFTYFYTSLIAIASSFYGMQQHLADPKLGSIQFIFAFILNFNLNLTNGYIINSNLKIEIISTDRTFLLITFIG